MPAPHDPAIGPLGGPLGGPVDGPPGSDRRPGRLLILGGARSGKSAEAERQLAGRPRVTYLATGGHRPEDPEWQARVAAHQARRPADWATLETVEVAAALRAATDPVLVDSVGLWLAGVLDRARAWGLPPSHPQPQRAVDAAVEDLLDAWRQAPVPVVLVSEEVGAGVVPQTQAGRVFRDALGTLNQRLAAAAEEVVLVVAGLPLTLKAPTPSSPTDPWSAP